MIVLTGLTYVRAVFADGVHGRMYIFAASFVMVKALGGNDRMAANIIALTTLLASVTITTGVFILQSIGVA